MKKGSEAGNGKIFNISRLFHRIIVINFFKKKFNIIWGYHILHRPFKSLMHDINSFLDYSRMLLILPFNHVDINFVTDYSCMSLTITNHIIH